MKNFTFLAVLDFEATCADRTSVGEWDSSLQEIIEIPMALVSIKDKCVVGSFDSFVRPIEQPVLTEFCTKLTSIKQSDVEASPDIVEVIRNLQIWLDQHNAAAENTLVVTCGDWDLKNMWPRQVGLRPELQTPRIFKSWCNLKFIYADKTKNKTSGMMGMLRALRIPHVGHHHRGRDDVRNLASIVISLLSQGATFKPTWTEEKRAGEYEKWLIKAKEVNSAIINKKDALSRLPDTVPVHVREELQASIKYLEVEAQRFSSMADVFSNN